MMLGKGLVKRVATFDTVIRRMGRIGKLKTVLRPLMWH